MAADWFVRVDGEQYGPYSSDQLKTYAKEGHITPASEIRRGDGPWCAATEVKGMFPEGTPLDATAAEGPPPPSTDSATSTQTATMAPPKPAAPPNGEEILYAHSPAMFRNYPVWFVLCLLLCLVGVGIVIFIVWYLRCVGTQLTVTSKRSTLRTGILSKNINEVSHRDIRNVRINQTFLQRVMGVGSLQLSSAGQSDVEIAVNGIPDPERVKQLINEYRD